MSESKDKSPKYSDDYVRGLDHGWIQGAVGASALAVLGFLYADKVMDINFHNLINPPGSHPISIPKDQR